MTPRLRGLHPDGGSRGARARATIPTSSSRFTIAALFPILIGGCATLAPEPPPPPLEARVDAITSLPPLNGVHWGILAVDAATGQPLYERNAHLRFVPASNMKIMVTVVALDLLGPDFRWETGFLAASAGLPCPGPGRCPVGGGCAGGDGGMAGGDGGMVRGDGGMARGSGGMARGDEGMAKGDVCTGPEDSSDRGVLRGDLYLPARGDPTLGEPFYDSYDEALRALADSLRAVGIREVQGDLVVDVSAWDSASVPSTWMVGNVSSRFGASGGAFAVGAGELEIVVRGGELPGDPALAKWRPLGREGFVKSLVTTGDPEEGSRVRAAFLPESRAWVLEGSLPPGDSLTLTRAARDPVRLGAEALAHALDERGITVRGEVRILWEPDEAVGDGCFSARLPECSSLVRVAGVRSPPLIEVTRAIMGPSHNWMTEQLVRTLGSELGEEGSWSEGHRIMLEHLTESMGVDSLDLHLRDGSGLSAYNLLAPRAVIAVLNHARQRSWGAAYRDALPTPGREDTTLEERLGGMEQRVFAKTGTISHVNGLSGYLVADDGREILFSILTNGSNLPAGEVRGAMDRVVRELARP